MSSDFELLERWQAGDRAAAKQLFERHFDAIYRFLASKVDHGVEDLVQETFLACVQGRDRFRGASSFRGYMFGTARNVLLSHYRKRRRLESVDEVGESRLIDLDPTASRMLAKREEERLVLEGLRRIPLDYQIILELYFWEGLSGPEVAELLGISLTAMRSRLHRAKQELQRQLESLSGSSELLASTLSNLDAWAVALRARLVSAKKEE
ncbi:MAG TPA: RNA polymerase sigma factor [Enhygromyxa sp.]|nr:RNA polymerase sigma factor [Enhygromyxa sp.]